MNLAHAIIRRTASEWRVLTVSVDPVTELAEVLRWTAPHDTVRAVRCPQTMRVGEVVRLDASGLEVVG